MKASRNLTFGPAHHPLQRVKHGNDNGQVRHKPVKYECNGKRVSAPRSHKSAGWTIP
mgnify:CR=1 FL=1